MIEPYYDDGAVKLYLGDCQKVLPELGTFDLVFTSPPYNLGTSPWPHVGNWKPDRPSGSGGQKLWRNGANSGHGLSYDDHKDSMPWPEYEEWQRQCLSALWGHLTDSGAIFYNHKPRVVGTRLWTPLSLVTNQIVRQIVVWARGSGMNFVPTAYMSTHEWLMILATPAWRLRDRGASGVGDVWNIPPQPGTPHPCPFPVELPATAIETAAPTSVLDPFCGSGTTLVAARAAGVPAVGIEKSERYCEMAVKRLAQGSLFGATA